MYPLASPDVYHVFKATKGKAATSSRRQCLSSQSWDFGVYLEKLRGGSDRMLVGLASSRGDPLWKA